MPSKPLIRLLTLLNSQSNLLQFSLLIPRILPEPLFLLFDILNPLSQLVHTLVVLLDRLGKFLLFVPEGHQVLLKHLKLISSHYKNSVLDFGNGSLKEL